MFGLSGWGTVFLMKLFLRFVFLKLNLSKKYCFAIKIIFPKFLFPNHCFLLTNEIGNEERNRINLLILSAN